MILCAEAVPGRSHRGLLADALVVRGVRVIHILAPGEPASTRSRPSRRSAGAASRIRPSGAKRKGRRPHLGPRGSHGA